MKDIVIIGAGKFGRETAWMIERINEENKTWNILGFADDTLDRQGTEIYGYPVLGGMDYLLNFTGEVYAVIAVGDTHGKRKILEKLSGNHGIKYTKIIAQTALVGKNSLVGEGSILCEGAAVTVDVSIGRHTAVNVGATISHDVIIGEFTTISPGVTICGNCTIGRDVFIGAGATIIDRIKIADNTIIGAGAVVIHDIEKVGTYVGVPARRLDKRSE